MDLNTDYMISLEFDRYLKKLIRIYDKGETGMTARRYRDLIHMLSNVDPEISKMAKIIIDNLYK